MLAASCVQLVFLSSEAFFDQTGSSNRPKILQATVGTVTETVTSVTSVI